MGSEYSSSTEKSILSSQTMDQEMHQHDNCKCKRRRLRYKGKYYYVFYRKCECKIFDDRSVSFHNNPENSDLPIGHINKDGVDIHGNADCHYQYTKQWGGKTQFRLHCSCKNVSKRTMNR